MALVVDPPHDFMKADGTLYVSDAEPIIANLARLTDDAHARNIRIVASAHVVETSVRGAA